MTLSEFICLRLLVFILLRCHSTPFVALISFFRKRFSTSRCQLPNRYAQTLSVITFCFFFCFIFLILCLRNMKILTRFLNTDSFLHLRYFNYKITLVLTVRSFSSVFLCPSFVTFIPNAYFSLVFCFNR